MRRLGTESLSQNRGRRDHEVDGSVPVHVDKKRRPQSKRGADEKRWGGENPLAVVRKQGQPPLIDGCQVLIAVAIDVPSRGVAPGAGLLEHIDFVEVPFPVVVEAEMAQTVRGGRDDVPASVAV